MNPDTASALSSFIVYMIFASFYQTLTYLEWWQQFRVYQGLSNSDGIFHRVVIRVVTMNVLQILATCILPHDEKPLLPDTQERALLKLGSAMLLMDTYQYWGHRLLHTQGLFTTVHIVHHRVRQLFAWAALYNSYIETLLLDIASFMLVESICGLTPYQAQGFAIFSTLKTVSDHSGYMLPWDPFTWFSNNAAYHAVHHKNRAYNFQQPFFTFWDELMGTKAIPGQL